MKSREDLILDLAGKVIGLIIAIILIALIFMWHNHVWIRWPITFLMWLGFGVPLALFGESPFVKYPAELLFVGTVFGQLAAWFGLISLPFFK